MLVAQGAFAGRNSHVMQGSFTIDEDGGELWFETSEDFFFDGSPEPGFAVSISGTLTEAEAISTDFLRLPSAGSLLGDRIEVRGTYRGRIPTSFEVRSAR